jgi:hypothetical protein
VSASKYIAFVPIGDAQATDANPRAVSLPRWAQGIFDFNDLVEGPLHTLYEHGFRRFMLWQPFGLTYPPGCHSKDCVKKWRYTVNGVAAICLTVQYVDDYLNLIALNYPPYRTMVKTFVPAINGFKSAHPDADIIIYNGSSLGNPHFNGLSDSQITARLNESLAPCFETKCDMAFDAACGIPPSHWMPRYYPTIEAAGLRVYVEAAPARYEYLKTKGFVSDLAQLKNVNRSNTRRMLPTAANGGFVGFLDPTLVKGERLGALFGQHPQRFASYLDWYKQIVPRALNSKQIDGMVLAMNPFVGPPYSSEILTLNDLTSQLQPTSESNYADYLT